MHNNQLSLFTRLCGLVLLLMPFLATGCGKIGTTTPKDESFIEIFEADKFGEKSYYSRSLYLYPDNMAFILDSKYLIACRVAKRTHESATLDVSATYDRTGREIIPNANVPKSFSIAWKGPDGPYVKTKALNYKNFKSPKYAFHKRTMYYDNIYALHEKLARQQHEEKLLADNTLAEKSSPDEPSATESASTRTRVSDTGQTSGASKDQVVAPASTLTKKNVSATGVPIKPDYSDGRSGGSLNQFTPENPIQFMDYYFGIIVFVFFLLELALIWYGAKCDDFNDEFDTYTTLCFILLLIESVFEIIIFSANPMVIFQSDMPLFGCYGRVLFFFSLCIGQAFEIRIIRAKLHNIYEVSYMPYGWILTCLMTGLTFLAVIALFNILNGGATDGNMIMGFRPRQLLVICIAGIWGLSLVHLIRLIAISHKAPLSVILFYGVIFPLFIPVAIIGLGIGLLAKIAIEKPDNTYEKVSDDDNSRYVTDALGNTVYIQRLSNNYWIDSNGGGYHQTGSNFTNIDTGTPFR